MKKVKSKYFSEREFQRCTPSCSLQDMEQYAMDKFDEAREIAGIPFVITCAYRSAEWDLSKGRSGKGAHTKRNALDIRCTNSENRFKIIGALLQVGCKRIGVSSTFIHADFDRELPQQVIWMY